MELNGTTNPARQENKDALEKDIGLTELDGFQLPRDVTEEFMTRMQEEVDILSMASEFTLDRLEMDLPMFGVPRLSGSTRDEEGSRTNNSSAESGAVSFDATDQSYYILVEPRRDAIKNTHYSEDQWGQLIIDEFSQRWANDIAVIAIRANADDANSNIESITGTTDLDDTFDGWIAIAEGEDTTSDRIGLEGTAGGQVDTMPSIDHLDSSIDTELFSDCIQKLDSRFRNTGQYNPVFLTSPNQVQQYYFDLTGREDGLGVAVLQGDNDITPFEYDLIGVPEFPDNYMMFTDPDNLSWGVFENMELDQTQDTDKVHEERLHSRNWLEGQVDFQIRKMQAGVLVENIADPATV
jgi:hypothetical protein